ncbi:hypothetical protein Bbelb_027660 [Branchiostoma belcheri]|nr:hypothetical protein Bbelb_027660 [Branchiostoma belcheri]
MTYEPRAVRGLGWTLVVLGCLSVTLGVAADITFAVHDVGTLGHYVSAPVWSGLLVLTTGILGIFSAKKPTNKCLIVAFMVVGIFVILACVCCIAIAALGIVLVHYVHSCRQYDWDGYYAAQARHESNPDEYDDPEVWHYKTFDCTPASIGLHAVNIFLAVLEIILGFVVSILSCCGLCTMRRPAAQVRFPVEQKETLSSCRESQVGAQGSQPQMFLAQNPGAAGAPVQVFYPAQQAPPAYQVDPGAASGAHDEKKGPLPAGSV